MATTEIRSAPINIRARQIQRDLIDKAANILNKNRSDFMLDASCQKAEDVLLDQKLFFLNNDQFEQFERALKEPVSGNRQIRELLNRKAPWEK